jgi:uncharacterized membrane protein HdeD (DUF308 family)
VNNKSTLQAKWWVLLIKGILFVVLGVIAIANIKATAVALLLWLGYYFLIQSLIEFADAWFQRQAGGQLWPPLLRGLLNLLLGLLVFLLPTATIILVIVLIVTYAIVQGVIDLFFAVRFRKELETGELVLLWLSGFAQLFFAFWMIFHPLLGGLALIIVIGIYAIVLGILYTLQALLSRFGSKPDTVSQA